MASSFDRPRVRPVPRAFDALDVAGRARHVAFDVDTLLVVVKPACDGCAEMLASDPALFAPLRLLLVSERDDDSGAWRRAGYDVLIAPDLLAKAGLRWPPVYAVIDAERGELVHEGTVFGPAQVVEETRNWRR